MNDDRPDLEKLERDARTAIEEQYGRPLTDHEWNEAKENLLRLARILRDWHRKQEDADAPS